MIAVLLVDPVPSIEAQFAGTRTKAVRRNPLPHAALHGEVPEWYEGTYEVKPDEQWRPDRTSLSMYDELLKYFEYIPEDQITFLLHGAPCNWAQHCCRIVLAKNASTVQSTFVETWKLVAKASTGVKKLADFDFDKLERKAWSDDWKGEFFTQLWELMEELELMQYRLQMNISVLRRVADCAAQVTLMGEQDLGRRGKCKEDGPSEDMRGTFIMQQDLEEWDKLMGMNSYAIQLMDRTTETYVQAIGATATQFANEQTKNSKKLTG